MKADHAQDPNVTSDLTRGVWAWLFWCLPAALVIAGDAWPRGMAWLWVVAFAMAGAGCLANAARCGRTHCYVTGPLFLLVAIWCLLSSLGAVALHPNVLFLVVATIAVLAYLAEIPLGRYVKVHR